jgi:hypothetical protein
MDGHLRVYRIRVGCRSSIVGRMKGVAQACLNNSTVSQTHFERSDACGQS